MSGYWDGREDQRFRTVDYGRAWRDRDYSDGIRAQEREEEERRYEEAAARRRQEREWEMERQREDAEMAAEYDRQMAAEYEKWCSEEQERQIAVVAEEEPKR